ncbi:uncharacterized protein LOC117893429 [Drosophila subobscura]|uniref:uncharacterized protein LOC117893429 n=1 Tax=Drosophila subobscura TaxID=7241 RepID=UPI00155A08D7|nr:uncharacterized protein LOC117893429 [Drosophila subobscura]
MCFLAPCCKCLCKCSTLRACILWACWNIIFGLLLIDQVLSLVKAQKLAAAIQIIGCLSGAGFTLSGLMLLAGILLVNRIKFSAKDCPIPHLFPPTGFALLGLLFDNCLWPEHTRHTLADSAIGYQITEMAANVDLEPTV